MIKQLTMSGIHLETDADLRKYVNKKIGRLDRFMPRKARGSVRADIKLKETKSKDKNIRTCEVILYLPSETITLSETTVNIYAAIDIVEAKLKVKLQKYKTKHNRWQLRRRYLSHFKNRFELAPKPKA